MRILSTSVLCLSALFLAGAAFAQAPAAPAADSAAPAGITLNLDNANAEDAFDQLAQQAGVDLIVNDGRIFSASAPVTIKVHNGKFWPAFIDVCRQSNVYFEPQYGQAGQRRALRLYSDTTNRLPKSYAESQGFVVIPTGVYRSNSIDYAHPENASSSLSMNLMVLMDPANPMGVRMRSTVTQAMDENKTSLVPPAGQSGQSNGEPESLVQTLSLPLACTPKTGKKLTILKGELAASVTKKTTKIELENITTMQPVKRDIGGCEVEIAPVAKGPGQNGSYQLSVTFRREPGTTPSLMRNLGAHEIYLLVASARITDSEGRQLSTGGGNGNGGEQDAVRSQTVYYNANNNSGEPAKLTWELPAEVAELRIPFELRELPLP